MDAIVGALITAILGGIVVHVLAGRTQRLDRLHERRAEVVAGLTERLVMVQRGLLEWTSPFQRGGVDREQQRRAAGEAFDDLNAFYRSNSIWLDTETGEKMEAFLETTYTLAGGYMDELNERGYPQNKEGRELGNRVMGEIPPLRRELEKQFRAILYPAPWHHPLRVFLQRVRERLLRNRPTDNPEPEREAGEREAGER